VFGKHKDCGSACFVEVASRAGVLDFLRFGHAAADAKKDPIKLLRLLEVFDSLNKLRCSMTDAHRRCP
jgi:exocyst complex component 7